VASVSNEPGNQSSIGIAFWLVLCVQQILHTTSQWKMGAEAPKSLPRAALNREPQILRHHRTHFQS
jgi:hypothetical protein